MDEALLRHSGRVHIPGQAIIDGEVVVIENGRTNFSELKAELAAGRQGQLVFYAFDLLWRDGDLRKHPQVARKAALSNLFAQYELEAPVLYSEHDWQWPTNVRTCRKVALGRDCL